MFGRMVSDKQFPLRPIVSIIIAAIAAGLSAYAVRLTFQPIPLITLARVLGQGIIAGTSGFAAYIFALTVLKNNDIAILRKSFTRRLITLRVLPQSWDGDTQV